MLAMPRRPIPVCRLPFVADVCSAEDTKTVKHVSGSETEAEAEAPVFSVTVRARQRFALRVTRK